MCGSQFEPGTSTGSPENPAGGLGYCEKSTLVLIRIWIRPLGPQSPHRFFVFFALIQTATKGSFYMSTPLYMVSPSNSKIFCLDFQPFERWCARLETPLLRKRTIYTFLPKTIWTYLWSLQKNYRGI